MAENGSQANNLPQLNVLAQFVKDFSFENPNAPRSLAPSTESPNISIQVNVNAQKARDEEFLVELLLEGSAKTSEMTLFSFELNFSSIFRVVNIPEQELHPVVMIECPRLLFPFARQIIGDAVRNGGFPPLYLDPIDFVALYRQRLADMGAPANAMPS